MYAILDIETTGGKFNEEGITEIAIYKFDGHEVVDNFVSLVNPEREIQPFVVKLTGINSKMLRNAPKFHEVAKRIVEITQDCVIVAHNALFDYRILRTEFNRLGYDFVRKTVCTVELSKTLIPEVESYKLGRLCKSLGIPVSSRHRADGDALATVQLFKLLLQKDIHKEIVSASISPEIKQNLAPKLQTLLVGLPKTKGVFYAHKVDGTIQYIGKGKNIQKSVNQLFLKDSKNAKRIQRDVTSISYDATGNQLILQLIYVQELEAKQPKFNILRKKQYKKIEFSNPNLLLIDKGRTIGEKSVILIENDILIGYCFVDLAHQIKQIDILHTLMTPLENNDQNRLIIKKYLQNNKIGKIVRF
ncbi:MAG: DNA polymerase III subunit epsilon [Flavobacteriaceae bacterium]|nr:MAG: DNA polymerase III subunit epsilon [Flavobacteriaceae bacterium]